MELNERVEQLRPGALLLLNETFATTTAREGSYLAWEITGALRESGVITFFVTHLDAFARRLYAERDINPDVEFLRAERLQDGSRTYQVKPGEPQTTSYGSDLYDQMLV
jgi:DNA mismatch repair ATPase MutS